MNHCDAQALPDLEGVIFESERQRSRNDLTEEGVKKRRPRKQ